jgi:hypothetical protein
LCGRDVRGGLAAGLRVVMTGGTTARRHTGMAEGRRNPRRGPMAAVA